MINSSLQVEQDAQITNNHESNDNNEISCYPASPGTSKVITECLQKNSQISESEYEEEEDSLIEQSKHLKMFHSLNEQEWCFDILKKITNNFDLTFKNIRDKEEITQAPLKFLKRKIYNTSQNIAAKIQKERESKINNNNIMSLFLKFYKKEGRTDKILTMSYHNIQKDKEKNKTLALTLLHEFNILDDYSQKRILDLLSQELSINKELFSKMIKNQVTQSSKRSIQLYENNQFEDLITFFNTVSPLSVIYLNIEISLTNSNLTEEGNTLSLILLPYLNMWNDYSFITSKEHFILTRFLHSLSLHIQDTNTQIQKGFILFALHLDANTLQNLMKSQLNREALKQAFEYKGFCSQASEYISTYPKKFLWSDLLLYFQGKQTSMILETIKIMSKLNIMKDPTQQVKILEKIFAQRKILQDILVEQDKIPLSLEDLTQTLENIKTLDSESIEGLIRQEVSQWKSQSFKIKSRDIVSEQVANTEVITKIFNELTGDIENAIQINDIVQLSYQVQNDCEQYNHNLYQCAITAILASRNEKFIVSVIPTGSGKTWIQTLLSKYFSQQGKKIKIIEPTQQLVNQTIEKIGSADYNISVSLPSYMYEFLNEEEIIILDEYDEIVSKYPYIISNNQLIGMWNLKKQNIYAFSATSNAALEKFINNVVGPLKIIKFKSEYELINGINPIALGNVISCPNDLKMLEKFKEDVEKFYEIKPIIAILHDSQKEEVERFLQKRKLKYLSGASERNLIEILEWDYGVLLIQPQDGRGVDIRFRKDAIVLIIAPIDNEIQYQQFIGRSSRKRNICEGQVYLHSLETTNQFLSRIKKQNFSFYQNLEQSLKLFSKKYNSQSLIDACIKQQQKGKQIFSIDDIRNILSRKQFQGLMRGYLG